MDVKVKNTIKEYVLLVAGCFIFSAGAVMFVEPYGFAPGGTYGLSMVFHHLLGWRTEVAALCMDIPLLIIGVIVIGRKFGIKTLIGTLLLPLFMWLMHTVYGYSSLIEPDVTELNLFKNQILAAIFGGIVYGVGLGLIFKSRATSGGSDIIAMIVNKYFHLPLGTCIIIVDGIITFTTVIAFGDWTLPMYSWIIIFVESKVIDRIVEGAPAKTMMIITDKIDEVSKVILDDMGRGATLIPGTGMYKGAERKILYVVLTRKEMITLRYRVAAIDPKAFINVIDSSEILGEGFKDIKE